MFGIEKCVNTTFIAAGKKAENRVGFTSETRI
jgi:hypothetical protein